jgi:hypothetical protein
VPPHFDLAGSKAYRKAYREHIAAGPQAEMEGVLMPIVETSVIQTPVEGRADGQREIEAAATVDRGEVRFAITNRGQLSHDFVVAAVADDGALEIRDGRVHEERVSGGSSHSLGADERTRRGGSLEPRTLSPVFERRRRLSAACVPSSPCSRQNQEHYERGTQQPAPEHPANESRYSEPRGVHEGPLSARARCAGERFTPFDVKS